MSFVNFTRLVWSLDRKAKQPSCEYARIFDVLDEAKNGFICDQSIRQTLAYLGEQASPEEIQRMLLGAHATDTNKIDLNTFLRVMEQTKVTDRAIDKFVEAKAELHQDCLALVQQLDGAVSQIESCTSPSPVRRQLTESGQGRQNFSELVEKVRRHIQLQSRRVGNEEEQENDVEDGLIVNSHYWLECDGIVVCRRTDAVAETELPDQEILIEGRLYAFYLKKYHRAWSNDLDPKDGVSYQTKMNFATYLSEYVWPSLSEEEREKLQQLPSVEWYDAEARKAFLVSRSDEKGRLLNADGKPYAPGLLMFVLSFEDELYIGKKIRGVRHHTSFLNAAEVRSAGMLIIGQDGKLAVVNSRSGHYNPREGDTLKLVNYLLKIGVDLRNTIIQYQARVEDVAEDLAHIGQATSSLRAHNLWRQLRQANSINKKPQLPN
eukprot:TRINITY_DN7543_c0_g1_i3.p1 TRINITY_DN7543_c0_g1~~TRINITY_DN7543_c0_g1_i3.p1  ORF type:complete len:434 (-),score=67.54 TRINITY_DN7543_c0_g1_i3:23-1324(-)